MNSIKHLEDLKLIKVSDLCKDKLRRMNFGDVVDAINLLEEKIRLLESEIQSNKPTVNT